MSLVCTICKNNTTSQHFVKLYHDTYEELFQNCLFHEKTAFSYVHLTCASFFLETELIILSGATNPPPADSNENSIVAETIVCNYKAIADQSPDKCIMCYNTPENETLAKCLVQGCNQRAHVQCIMNRPDIGKLKLRKTDDTTFKYGIICPGHVQELTMNPQQNLVLEGDSYRFFKYIDHAQLQEELQEYEDMFTNVSSIIVNDPELHKIFALSAQRKKKENTTPKKPKEKRQHKKSESKGDNQQAPEKPKPKESPVAKPVQVEQKPKKEKKELPLGVAGGLKRGKNGILSFRFRTKNRPEENKDGKEGGDLSKTSAKKRDRSRKKSIDPSQLTPKSESSKAVAKAGDETTAGSTTTTTHHGHKDGVEATEALIMMRKKKAGDSLYNLRDEIKATSRLKFDTLVDNFPPSKKAKEKTTSNGENNRLLTSEEKKKLFWNEVNEIYFRKPYTDEAELLVFSEIRDINTAVQAELNNIEVPLAEEDKEAFQPEFDIPELTPDFVPATFNPFDSLKVMFEFHNNASDPVNKRNAGYLGYFRMKKKAQNEMPVPEDAAETIDTSTDPKYSAIFAGQNEQLKDLVQTNLKPHTFKSKYKFNDQNVDYQELSIEGFHKLFGLKHIEPMMAEDIQTIKARNMLAHELNKMEEEKEDKKELSELSKEIIYIRYLLQQFVVPENNVRREKFTYKMKEDFALPKTNKLQEKTKKLESELKLGTTKKYFHNGFADRTTNTLTKSYFKSTSDQIVSNLTIIPKKDDDDEDDSKIIRIARQTKPVPVEVVETDCCICFSNQFSEYNPIIYCSHNSCNASFHKYCYGIAEIPSEDFYCDMCLASNDPALRKKSAGQSKLRKSSFRAKITPADKDVRCHLCSVEEFPLKRFKKSDWFHVTCLLLHDMLQFKNGEWLLKTEKAGLLEQAKSENSQVECSICKVKTGIVDKCAGQDCNKHVHVLCAYLQGYEIDLIECDDSKDDKTKNGFNTHVFCADHARNPNRNIIQQQYFRRYTTNYKNTLSYETLDDYVKHLNEEEDTSQITTQVDEFSASSKINEVVNGNELIGHSVDKREPEVATEDLDTQFLGGLAKKTKVG